MAKNSNQQNSPPSERVVGLDCHPDSFTAAIISGPTPASARVDQIFNKLPIRQLVQWAQKNLTSHDLVLLEASGNSFYAVRQLAKVGLRAKVLESGHLGKLKEHHANNDKISAVRIGKAYLSGTSKEVWVPDLQTQERRDLFHSHRKSVKRTTQVRNRLLSYLSDNGVRLPKGVTLARGDQETLDFLQKRHCWTTRQWQTIEGLVEDLNHAEKQRARYRSMIAQEVLADPLMLSIVRLCGVRDLIAFALGAIIGDIKRFPTPAKLVKYIGLNPAFDDSGEGKWSGGLTHCGRSDLRCLLVEAAQAILRSTHELARWGKKLLARKGSIKLVVAAIARKLAVAVWYLMMGKWTPLEELDARLEIKVSKILTEVGRSGLKALKKTRKELKAEVYESLKKGRVYCLDLDKKFLSGEKPKIKFERRLTLREEYGIE